MLCMLAISLWTVWPTATAHAADSTWHDLPDNLFSRMVCFDGANADVLWATDGNAYLWKTSTKITDYPMPDLHSLGSAWCGTDGWFYNGEVARSDTTSQTEHVTLMRRSTIQAPQLITTLAQDYMSYHEDTRGS